MDARPDLCVDLSHGWAMAEVPAGADAAAIAAFAAAEWLPATVPGSSHGVLLAHGRIPDPFVGLNETAVQWVGERCWAWRLHFDAPPAAPHVDLLFDGLDTCCTAWLNGEPLLHSENMFVPQRVPVAGRLRARRNELLLVFHPALARARQLQALHDAGRSQPRPLWNGDAARLHLRKAAYHFGWDWGPTLLTCGPWRPVRLHAYAVRIEDLHCRQQVDVSARRAQLQLDVQLAGVLPPGAELVVEVLAPDGASAARATLPVPEPAALATGPALSATLALHDIALWWPNGFGAQPLYTVATRVQADGQTLAQDRRRIGLRTVRLLQQPVAGEAGSSFHFEVNGHEMFVGGANWIPDDNLLERITPERYRQRVALAAAAHMTMLRVWGGGLYEHEAFYDACDELGVLVWQDFLFSCGLYPAYPGFRASVAEEAGAVLRRLRHRPCMALWCGNNEDYMLAESVGLHGPGIAADALEARVLYEDLLPTLCRNLDPDRDYWPGSPFTPADASQRSCSDPSAGDRHSWEVWHQQMLPYQRYGEVQARFVSEFGLQSHPSLAVWEATLPPLERYPESRTVAWHNKAGTGSPDGHRRLAVYLADNVCVGPTLADHVYATQFVQAEAMRYAYQDFRRRWQVAGARAVGGALVWQLNDCWPAVSWAIVDAAGHVKPAWHTIRRALAPQAVSARLEGSAVRLVFCNARPEAWAASWQLRLHALDGRLVHEAWGAASVPAAGCCELLVDLPAGLEPCVAEAKVPGPAGTAAAARDVAWPQPHRFYRLAAAGLRARVEADRLYLAVQRPLKGLWLEAPGTAFEDNFIDLVPGPEWPVQWKGDAPRAVRATALDQPTLQLQPTAVPSTGIPISPRPLGSPNDHLETTP